jgi:hypothetical protein
MKATSRAEGRPHGRRSAEAAKDLALDLASGEEGSGPSVLSRPRSRSRILGTFTGHQPLGGGLWDGVRLYGKPQLGGMAERTNPTVLKISPRVFRVSWDRLQAS